MFFALSKILYGLVSPLSWVVYALLVALVWRRYRRRALGVALVVLLLISNDFLVSEALRWWEGSPVVLDHEPPFDVAIVLTGGIVGEGSAHRNHPSFGSSSDRLLQAFLLLKQGRVRQILISGGSGKLFGPDLYPDEGQVAARFLRACGVDSAQIRLETRSRNTHENARFTAEMLKNSGIKGRYLLVTTAFHMRRATACFRKAGLPVTPYPVDFRAGPAGWSAVHFWPTTDALDRFDRLVREWVGYLTYRVMGYC